MPALPAPVQAVLTAPQDHLAGTDLRITIPVGRNLLNEVLAARPPDTPVKELYMDQDPGNLLHVHLTAAAPVVGRIKRVLTLRPGPPVSFPDQPWLNFEIVSGFKFIDKPVIRVMQNTIAEKLPKGVEFSSSRLRVHVPAMLTQAGYQQLAPLLHQLEVRGGDNQLIINLHLKAN